MSEHIAACAHLKICYRTKDNGDGTVSGWWECDNDCGMKFTPDLFVTHIVTCDLCDEPAELAEYHQCQGCMNDMLVGSHTDEEWEALQRQVEGLRKYATHKFECPVLNKWPQDCTCGLEALESGDDDEQEKRTAKDS